MQRHDLERMGREQLIAQAERLGIPRPRVLTQPELVDEIIGRTTKDDRERVKARGWLGRARDLLANVVEKGLHLPEAARALRQEDKGWPPPPAPLSTVTLAEIYAAQGHYERAITVLDEVLTREPEHREARSMRERFVEQLNRSRSRAGRVEVPPAPPAPVKAARQPREAAEKKETQTMGETPKPPAQPVEVVAAPETPVSQDEALASTEKAPERVEERSAAAVESAAVETPDGIAASDVVEEAAAAGEEPDALADAALESPASLESLESLEEPALPQRYEVDEVVAIAVDPRTIYLYWEVRPTTLARARAQHPDGGLVLRVASVTASWEGPVVDTRDLHVDALYGDRFLRDVQPGSNVRVSVGWKSAAGFEPLAVGAEVTAPRAVPVESVAQEVGRWEETPPAPFSAWRGDATLPPARADLLPLEVSRPATSVPWARSITGFAPSAQGTPVDTGVAIWGEPFVAAIGAEGREEILEGEIVEEQSWFIAGGASELSRGGPGRVRTVRVRRLLPGSLAQEASLAHLGGASELHLGGASDLARP